MPNFIDPTPYITTLKAYYKQGADAIISGRVPLSFAASHALNAVSIMKPLFRFYFEEHCIKGRSFQDVALTKAEPVQWAAHMCKTAWREFAAALVDVHPLMEHLMIRQECCGLLEVSVEDSDEFIDDQFRRLLSEHDPDKNCHSDATERARKREKAMALTAAYEFLMDDRESTRAFYGAGELR